MDLTYINSIIILKKSATPGIEHTCTRTKHKRMEPLSQTGIE